MSSRYLRRPFDDFTMPLDVFMIEPPVQLFFAAVFFSNILNYWKELIKYEYQTKKSSFIANQMVLMWDAATIKLPKAIKKHVKMKRVIKKEMRRSKLRVWNGSWMWTNTSRICDEKVWIKGEETLIDLMTWFYLCSKLITKILINKRERFLFDASNTRPSTVQLLCVACNEKLTWFESNWKS